MNLWILATGFKQRIRAKVLDPLQRRCWTRVLVLDSPLFHNKDVERSFQKCLLQLLGFSSRWYEVAASLLSVWNNTRRSLAYVLSLINTCTWSSTIPMSCMLARVYFNTCMHQCMQWVVIPIVSSMNAMGRVVIPILHYVSSIIVIMWQWDGETLHMVICPLYQQVLTLIHTCTWFSSIPMTSMLARVYTWFSTIPLQRRRTFSPEALVSLYYV